MQAADSYFVDFRDVWLAYNDELRAKNQFAVEAIDLQVRRGEFIAIVGPSGCGKSTFMKLATGLRRPSKGTVIIDGREVTGPLKITGMAFQAPSLLPWRTTVDKMVAAGMKAPEDQVNIIIEYLYRSYPADDVPRLKVNEAEALDFESILSLKRSQANAIIKYREQHGKFKSIEDLKKIPGLDAAKLEEKKDRLIFE